MTKLNFFLSSSQSLFVISHLLSIIFQSLSLFFWLIQPFHKDFTLEKSQMGLLSWQTDQFLWTWKLLVLKIVWPPSRHQWFSCGNRLSGPPVSRRHRHRHHSESLPQTIYEVAHIRHQQDTFSVSLHASKRWKNRVKILFWILILTCFVWWRLVTQTAGGWASKRSLFKEIHLLLSDTTASLESL